MSRTAVNRAVVAVAGLFLLVGGVLVLAGGFDLYGRIGLGHPGWWPLTSPDQPLVGAAARTRWADRDWWWPTVIGVLVLLLAGALWWIFAQLRRSGPAVLRLPVPDGGGAVLRLRSRALEEAVAAETGDLPDVLGARVRLVGNRRRPLLRVAVRLRASGRPDDLLEQFHTGPLVHARTSLGLPDLPVHLRLRVATPRRKAEPEPPRVL
ncbi:alkaline shock response membrane anchor protein AmaP [Kitasatospora sp. NPDC056138]|uniref:alkaline shock response membrane anchor protein AmaP n=1 Tax=Kitasatospora sp. NPDC056138 TaxID=3345724 RepID=UPI0035DA7516